MMRRRLEVNEEDDIPIRIDEKPENPRPSCYVLARFYDSSVVDPNKKNLSPLARGELEITATGHAEFLDDRRLAVETLGRGYAWLDTGTHDSLLDASNYIATIERLYGQKIACIGADRLAPAVDRRHEIGKFGRAVDVLRLRRVSYALIEQSSAFDAGHATRTSRSSIDRAAVISRRTGHFFNPVEPRYREAGIELTSHRNFSRSTKNTLRACISSCQDPKVNKIVCPAAFTTSSSTYAKAAAHGSGMGQHRLGWRYTKAGLRATARFLPTDFVS